MRDGLVDTTFGAVRGAIHGEVATWKGIPFAAPPVGPLRFRPPVPPAAWDGERDATRFGDVALQARDPRVAMLSGVPAKATSSEDALTLNIFAPTTEGPHPVMVWIHGGAFVMGAGSSPLYQGEPFARQGVVTVTLNYRLGLAGFLYLGDLAPDREAGNHGLLDQIAALRWVQDNIAAFGGDPACVTVMGESAGAISIAMLMAMPAARGLFQRAILESGGAPLVPPTRADATRVARRVLAELAVGVDELAHVPGAALLKLQETLSAELGLGAIAPYVDGVTIPARPIDRLRGGSAADVAVLAGSNRDEFTLFHAFLGDASVDGFKAPLRDKLGAHLDRMLDVYRRAEPGRSEQRAWVDLVGELVFRIPTLRVADAQLAQGAPVYVYRFDWRSPALGSQFGAAHAFELPFVWDRLDLPMQVLLGDDIAPLQPLATTMHQAWVRFIKTGDPGGADLAWPAYSAARPTMIFELAPHVADDPSGEARALWDVFP